MPESECLGMWLEQTQTRLALFPRPSLACRMPPVFDQLVANCKQSKNGGREASPGNEGRRPRNEGIRPRNEGIRPSNEGRRPRNEGRRPSNEGRRPRNEAEKA